MSPEMIAFMQEEGLALINATDAGHFYAVSPVTDPAGFSSSLASDLYLVILQIFRLLVRTVHLVVNEPILFCTFGFLALGLSIGVFGYLIRG